MIQFITVTDPRYATVRGSALDRVCTEDTRKEVKNVAPMRRITEVQQTAWGPDPEIHLLSGGNVQDFISQAHCFVNIIRFRQAESYDFFYIYMELAFSMS